MEGFFFRLKIEEITVGPKRSQPREGEGYHSFPQWETDIPRKELRILKKAS
jgi:hypothetical protein